jgi:hypothetical protein
VQVASSRQQHAVVMALIFHASTPPSRRRTASTASLFESCIFEGDDSKSLVLRDTPLLRSLTMWLVCDASYFSSTWMVKRSELGDLEAASSSPGSAELPRTAKHALRRHRGRAGALPRGHFDHGGLPTPDRRRRTAARAGEEEALEFVQDLSSSSKAMEGSEDELEDPYVVRTEDEEGNKAELLIKPRDNRLRKTYPRCA